MWRQNNPDRVAKKARKHGLKKRYGITPEEYDEMLARQGGGCMICGGQSVAGRRLSVDHNHKTNQVRDLLCTACNHLLGDAREDITILTRAIQYLERWSDG